MDDVYSSPFTVNAMKCPCCGVCNMQLVFMSKLQALAVQLPEMPFKVNSGFRCPAHNKAVGGEPDSQHLYGNAVDLAVGPGLRYKLIAQAIAFHFNGIGVGKTFVHIDNRATNPVVWTYPL